MKKKKDKKSSRFITPFVDKRNEDLEIGEKTHPRQSGKFNGVSIGRDEDGWYVFTHRARSESKKSVDKIPKKDIKWIESTGKKKPTIPIRRVGGD